MRICVYGDSSVTPLTQFAVRNRLAATSALAALHLMHHLCDEGVAVDSVHRNNAPNPLLFSLIPARRRSVDGYIRCTELAMFSRPYSLTETERHFHSQVIAVLSLAEDNFQRTLEAIATRGPHRGRKLVERRPKYRELRFVLSGTLHRANHIDSMVNYFRFEAPSIKRAVPSVCVGFLGTMEGWPITCPRDEVVPDRDSVQGGTLHFDHVHRASGKRFRVRIILDHYTLHREEMSAVEFSF